METADEENDDILVKPLQIQNALGETNASAVAQEHQQTEQTQSNDQQMPDVETDESNEEETDDGDGDGDNDDESDDSEPIESLVQGRERRSNQANRYATLLQQETTDNDPHDELNDIFQEGGDEDTDFERSSGSDASDNAGDDDGDDDSSSDNEDQGPSAEDGDLEGEKQLKKEERAAKQAEKRKADRALTKIPTVRKRVKIDESATPDSSKATPQAEPKRKLSERKSWLPVDAPARTSSRTLSVQNKQRTMASMKENEKKRMKQLAVMEAAQKRKAETKTKPMTQADRMAEAARTEELNSKSLSRWEEMEEEKARKQAARLEAMQNRKIDGPFVRWYSGKAEWGDGRLQSYGKTPVTEVVRLYQEDDESDKPVQPKKKPGRKPKQPKDANTTDEAAKKVDEQSMVEGRDTNATTSDGPSAVATPRDYTASEDFEKGDPHNNGSENHSAAISEPDASLHDNHEAPEEEPEELEEPSDDQKGTLYPSTTEKLKDESIQAISSDNAEALPSPPAISAVVHAENQTETTTEKNPNEPAIDAKPLKPLSAPPPATEGEPPVKLEQDMEQPRPEAAKVLEYTTRNVVTLENYEVAAISDPIMQRSVIFGTPLPSNYGPSAHITMRSMRPPKVAPSVCVVTKQPAKYLDPATGLPYASLNAYKAIQKVVDGNCVWSDLLGAWAGGNEKATNGGAAINTTEGFFSGVLPERTVEANSTDEIVKPEPVH